MFYNYEEQDDNKDSDYYQGQDASSNGEQRRKIIFARHFSSIGDFFLKLFLFQSNLKKKIEL